MSSLNLFQFFVYLVLVFDGLLITNFLCVGCWVCSHHIEKAVISIYRLFKVEVGEIFQQLLWTLFWGHKNVLLIHLLLHSLTDLMSIYWISNLVSNELCDNSSFCLGSKSGFFSKELINKQASMTGGLVGQSEHLIFPAVPPIITVMLTLLSVLVRSLNYLVCCAYFRTSLMTIFNEN